MKHLSSILLTFSLVFSCASIVEAQTALPTRVWIDGVQAKSDQPPVNLSGTTMVPIRSYLETLGAEVTWNGTTKTVTAKKRNQTITLQHDSKTAYQNGVAFELRQTVRLMNGQMIVPLRFVGEALGAKVEWDGTSNTVAVTSSEQLLLMAVEQGDSELALALLETGADPNAHDQDDKTVLHAALRDKNLDVARALLQAGADPNARTVTGETPLAFAISFNREPEALDMLVAAGLDVKDGQTYGAGLLNTAISYNNTPMVKALLAHGVDPNRGAGLPPLVQAAYKGNVEAVQILLGANADLFIQTPNGHTAMMYALTTKRQDVIEVLQQAGDTTTTAPDDILEHNEPEEEMQEHMKEFVEMVVVHGMDDNDYGLAQDEAIMFLELDDSHARMDFFNLSEAAQKEMILEYFQDHAGEMQGAAHCYTYLTFDGNVVLGADLRHDMSAEDVELVFGPRVPMNK